MILIDSVYINNSGGKVLLDYLVSELEKRGICPFYLFDSRCSKDYIEIPEERKKFIKASLWNRYKFYKKYRNQIHSVFCFGNIPPPIKLNVPVFTYFHNILRAKPFKYKNLLKYYIVLIKKQYIKILSKNTSFFIVQTDFVKRVICEEFDIEHKRCLTIPFFYVNKTNIENKAKKEGFVYISNGYLHKNHLKLLESWELLSGCGFYPELHLTVTKDYPLLIAKINELKEKNVQIYNHGFIDPSYLYSRYKYVIYPSLHESFGLGLIEGAMFGCDIIASDKEFVHNVIIPSKVFDPTNSQSIVVTIMEVLKKGCKDTKLLVNNQIDNLLEIINK